MSASRDELAERLLHHRAWLRAVARELVGEASAEDVVQETWAAALARPPSGALRPWLGAVARRAALFMRRGDAARRAREVRAARPEATASTAALIERIDAEERVVRELRALEEPFRTTLLRRYHEGLSAAEIARRDGVPEGTVRWRTKRGLDELRERLERAFGGREAFGAALLPLARGGAPPGTAVAVGSGIGVGGVLAMTSGKWIVGAGVVATLIAAGIGVQRWRSGAAASARADAAPVALREPDAPVPARATDASVPAGEVAERESLPAGAAPGARPRLRILESDRSAHAGKTVLASAAEPAMLRTDGEGRVELPVGAETCEVLIERAGAFPHRATVALAAGEQELVLPEEVVLEGRIVVGGGPPVRPLALVLFPAASADERPYTDPARSLPAFALEVVSVRTDAEGRFLVRGARGDQGYNVRLPLGYVLPGEPPDPGVQPPVQFHLPRAARGVVLEVERLPSIVGRLVESDGRTPTAGVVECRYTWTIGTNMNDGARADEDGWFEFFPDQPWRAIELEYWGAPGERGRASASFERADVRADGLLGDLRLAEGRTLTLRVLDPDGVPLADARTDLNSAPTDERGETVLRDVTAGSMRVVARGHRETRIELPRGGGTLEATLARAPELFLEVRDRRGVPVGNLAVELRAASYLFDGNPSMLSSPLREGRLMTWDRTPFAARYTVSEAGALRADSLLPDVPFELRVLGWGGKVLHSEPMPGLGPDERRRLVVEVDAEVVELAGRVVDGRGAPLRGVVLGLPAIRAGSATFPVTNTKRTDADGRFRCAVLDLPDLRIVVRHAGYLPRVIDLPSGKHAELEIVLEKGLDVRVSVLDELGRPQAGGTLSVRGAGEAWIHGESPGRFAVGGLPAGRHEYVLRVGGREFVRAHEAHEPELVFRVPAMGALDASWALPRTPESTEFIHLQLRMAEDGGIVLQQGFHDTPAGEHRFDPVLPGAYELVLMADTDSGEVVLARGPVEVVAGETARAALAP